MSIDVEDALIEKIEQHIVSHSLTSFNSIFHGGEPTLFGTTRFTRLVTKLEEVGTRTGCEMDFSLTTNGVLITRVWADLFKCHAVQVAVSIDGPQDVHDANRLNHSGLGSHAAAVRGYRLLADAGIDPSIIAVCNPSSSPVRTLGFLADELGCSRFDILPPDLNHDDCVTPIGNYYINLFDAWYDQYFDKGVRIRFLLSLIRSVLGWPTNSDSFGYGPLHTITVSTDGLLEPNDVLRIGGAARTASKANIRDNTLDDAKKQAAWKDAYKSALQLCLTCESCKFRNACGGGHLSHRWSKERGYDNPSVYCSDLIQMLEHVWTRVSKDIYVVQSGILHS
jgi:uncharacterized protein